MIGPPPTPSAAHLFSLFFMQRRFETLIILLFFSHETPLFLSASRGRLDVTRLLVESKADVAARDRCFCPPPCHHVSLTICLVAMVSLHCCVPATALKPTLLHTCAASARRNDAPPRAAAAPIKAVLVRVSAGIWHLPLWGRGGGGSHRCRGNCFEQRSRRRGCSAAFVSQASCPPRFGPHLQPHSLQTPGASHFLVFCSKLLLLHMLPLPLV